MYNKIWINMASCQIEIDSTQQIMDTSNVILHWQGLYLVTFKCLDVHDPKKFYLYTGFPHGPDSLKRLIGCLDLFGNFPKIDKTKMWRKGPLKTSWLYQFCRPITVGLIGFNIFFGKEFLCGRKIKSSETTLADDNIAN